MLMKPLHERFWAKVNKEGPIHPTLKTRCWLWTGSVRGKGYGTISIDGVMQSAHRVSWFLIFGIWPTKQICHKCDVMNCIRSSHLFEGTNKENMEDKARKGRANSQQGEQCGAAKLTAEQVLKIRKALRRGETGTHIAKRYRVTHSSITNIKMRKTWKSVPDV